MPNLLAFKERGGFKILNSMLSIFKTLICENSGKKTADSTRAKVASFGLKKILDLYLVLMNGKSVSDSTNMFSLVNRPDRSRDLGIIQQLLVELRMAVLPTLVDLWNSSLFEHVPAETIVTLLDILNLVSTNDFELVPSHRGEDKVCIFLNPIHSFPGLTASLSSPIYLDPFENLHTSKRTIQLGSSCTTGRKMHADI
jgi:E3 ubiquitin-protein ligase HUWE1